MAAAPSDRSPRLTSHSLFSLSLSLFLWPESDERALRHSHLHSERQVVGSELRALNLPVNQAVIFFEGYDTVL